jgi:hypothetical protein
MENRVTPNPYRPLPDENDLSAPFAGRQKAFEFLYQRLTDPAGTESSLIMGRQEGGKTALLHHFNRFFDETFVSVYIPLAEKRLNSEADWLELLAKEATRALSEHNYTLSRLPEWDTATTDKRGWFSTTYLPEILNIIRRQRRLVFLLDDANALLQAVAAEKLPADTISYLHGLVEAHPQLGIVLTLDSQFEADIPKLSPLISLEAIFRLANLSEEEVTWLLTEPASDLYNLTADATAAVYKATGGQPRLVQRFGFQLFKLWETRPTRTVLTVEDVKQVTPAVYAASEKDLHAAWTATTRNERLALTAITSLIYADPLNTPTQAGLESWLVETDYPLDSTAIKAAIRGLEYREIVEHTPSGIRLTSTLMQNWLMENGRLTEGRISGEIRRPGLRWLAVAALALLIVALVLIASQTSAPVTANETAPVATVTLVANP